MSAQDDPRLAPAIAHQCAGRFDEAMAGYNAVLASNPGHVWCLYYLGVLHLQQGRAAEAAEALHAALRNNPDFAEAHSGLGAAYRALQRLDDSAACHEQALALAGEQPEAHYNLADAYRALARFEPAITAYQQAIARDPDYAEAHLGLGLVLQNLGRHAKAVPCFEQALDVDPEYHEARTHLAISLHALDRFAESAAQFQHVLAAKPDDAKAHYELGRLYHDYGRIADARAAFEQAILHGAGNKTDYYFSLAECTRFRPGNPHLASLENLAQRLPSLADSERINLHFTLGKAYDDLGRHAEAFDHYLQGNTLKRRQLAYDEARTLAVMKHIQAVFTPALIAEKNRFGDRSAAPIFIVGMPRSGSTLVEQILASHPQVVGIGEVTAFADVLAELAGSDGKPPPYPQMAETLLPETQARLGAGYVQRMRHLAPGADRVVNKALVNFVFVGLIHLVLPNARIIHTARDPRDTCFSCFTKQFSGDLPYTYDLRELGRHYRCYAELMRHWDRVLPPGVLLNICYEDLVDDMAGHVRAMIAHCGLPWDAACLSFDRTERFVRTASATQVREPIFRGSIGRYRPYAAMLADLGFGVE